MNHQAIHALTLETIHFLLDVKLEQQDKTVGFVTKYLFDVTKHEELLMVFQRRFIIQDHPDMDPLQALLDWITVHLRAFELLYFNGDKIDSPIHSEYVKRRGEMLQAIFSLSSLKTDLVRIQQTTEWSPLYSDLHDYIDSTNEQLNEILSKRRSEMQTLHSYINLHQDRFAQLERRLDLLEEENQRLRVQLLRSKRKRSQVEEY